MAAILAPFGLVATMGATDCDDFDPVVIPAHDDVDPLVGTRMLVNGHDQIFVEEVDIETHSPTATYEIYPFVMDSGGARRLEMWTHFEVTCRDPEGQEPGLGYIADGYPQIDEQDGDVGDVVSNGIYRHLTSFDASDYANDCHGGQVLESAELNWTIYGEDFAGNESEHHNTIVFRPTGACGCANGPLGNLCLPAYDGCNIGFHPVCQSGSCGSCSCQ